MKKILIKLGIAFSLIVTITLAYAGSGYLFRVTSTGTPANVNITLCLDGRGPVSCQNYDVNSTNLSIISTVNHTYPNAGIISNTKGYTPTGCTNISNGYCLFSTSQTTPAAIILQNTAVKQPRFAYATSWDGDMLGLCSVSSDGALTNCNSITAPNALGVNQLSNSPGGIAINPAGTLAYIADYGTGVLKCDINSTNGILSNCVLTGSGYSHPTEISFNAAGTFAYIADYTSGIPMYICSVDAGTGDLTNCYSSTYASFAYPTNVAFTASGNKAYVGTYDISQVYLCDVNQTNGDLSSCTLTPTSPPADMYYTTGVALNPAGNILYVVSNDYNLVYKCSVNPDGTLGACTSTGTGTGGWPGFSGPFGITLNAAGTIAYIAHYSAGDQVTACSVDSSTGELVNCAETGSGFSYPLFVALLY